MDAGRTHKKTTKGRKPFGGFNLSGRLALGIKQPAVPGKRQDQKL